MMPKTPVFLRVHTNTPLSNHMKRWLPTLTQSGHASPAHPSATVKPPRDVFRTPASAVAEPRRAPSRHPRATAAASSARARSAAVGGASACRVRRPRPRPSLGPRRGGRRARRFAPRAAPPPRGGQPVAAGLEGVRGRHARARAASCRRARRRRRAQLLGRSLRTPQFPAAHPCKASFSPFSSARLLAVPATCLTN